MGCTIVHKAYSTTEAIVIEKRLVQHDHVEDKDYVWIWKDKKVKQFVTKGHESDKLIEIKNGLSAGDELVKYPKND